MKRSILRPNGISILEAAFSPCKYQSPWIISHHSKHGNLLLVENCSHFLDGSLPGVLQMLSEPAPPPPLIFIAPASLLQKPVNGHVFCRTYSPGGDRKSTETQHNILYPKIPGMGFLIKVWPVLIWRGRGKVLNWERIFLIMMCSSIQGSYGKLRITCDPQ